MNYQKMLLPIFETIETLLQISETIDILLPILETIIMLLLASETIDVLLLSDPNACAYILKASLQTDEYWKATCSFTNIKITLWLSLLYWSHGVILLLYVCFVIKKAVTE